MSIGLVIDPVHAGIETGLRAVGAGIGGQGENRHLSGTSLQTADPACRGQAVHARHVQVHQHDVRQQIVPQGFQRRRTVGRKPHAKARLLQQRLGEPAVRHHVIDHQHKHAGR